MRPGGGGPPGGLRRVVLALLFACALSSLLLLALSGARARAPLRAAPAGASADAGALALVRAALLGGVAAPPNVWRAALVRARLDWHDLVPVASPPARGDAAAAALQRHRRDDAKDALLELLQDAAPRAGGARGGESAQGRLVAALRRAAAAERAPLRALLARADAVAAAALAAGVEADDVADLREGGDGGDAARGCAATREKCLVHGSLRSCARDAFCGWCAARSACLTRGAAFVRCEPAPGAASAPGAALVRARGAPLARAEGVLVVAADSLPPARANCSLVVRAHALRVAIRGNSKMAYHWATETLPGWLADARAAPGGARAAASVVLVEGEWNDLLNFASVFSPSCPRAAESAEVAAACFAPPAAGAPAAAAAAADADAGADADAPDAPPPALAVVDARSGALVAALSAADAAALVEPLDAALRAGARLSARGAARAVDAIARGGADAAAWLAPLGAAGAAAAPAALAAAAAAAAQRLRAADAPDDFGAAAARACGTWWAPPRAAGAPPLVVVVSRLNKRLILNEAALCRAALALGADVRLAALERMSVCAQARLFAAADVVVGVHGSALINSFFMRRGAALLQIVPYGVRGAAAFFEGPAAARGVRYAEVAVDARGDSVAHAHFLKPNASADALLADSRAGRVVDQATWFSFVINQDSVVNATIFYDALASALAPQSKAQ